MLAFVMLIQMKYPEFPANVPEVAEPFMAKLIGFFIGLSILVALGTMILLIALLVVGVIGECLVIPVINLMRGRDAYGNPK